MLLHADCIYHVIKLWFNTASGSDFLLYLNLYYNLTPSWITYSWFIEKLANKFLLLKQFFSSIPTGNNKQLIFQQLYLICFIVENVDTLAKILTFLNKFIINSKLICEAAQAHRTKFYWLGKSVREYLVQTIFMSPDLLN